MLNALTYAFLDSINVLLIAVVVALGMMLPAGRYRRITPLLVFGDWLGVAVLALAVLVVFDGLGDQVAALVESPLFGVLLIITGLATAVLTFRGGDSSALVEKILAPLRTPSIMTVATGFVLGAIQSVTSVPFFAGLAVLSAGGLPVVERYLGLILYASVALSLPTLVAIAVGIVRHRPNSWLGRIFAAARDNQAKVSRGAGYLVAVLLILIGALHL
ncbi:MULTISPECIES: hypothetical protein [Corynebacterium]|uniref:hypothetical protein n=1 Tax=Corynebacterium TaxID=1716 RepID=UPI0017E90D43|nr:hypothetical protein [Corynebacterium sp.]HHT32733.1 hypothetical protein [Corynebacterium sp.]